MWLLIPAPPFVMYHWKLGWPWEEARELYSNDISFLTICRDQKGTATTTTDDSHKINTHIHTISNNIIAQCKWILHSITMDKK